MLRKEQILMEVLNLEKTTLIWEKITMQSYRRKVAKITTKLNRNKNDKVDKIFQKSITRTGDA